MTLKQLICILLAALCVSGCAPSRKRCERAYGPCGWEKQQPGPRVWELDTTAIADGTELPERHIGLRGLTGGDTLRFEEDQFWAEVNLRRPEDSAAPDSAALHPPLMQLGDWRLQLRGGCDTVRIPIHIRDTITPEWLTAGNGTFWRPPPPKPDPTLWDRARPWVVLGAVVLGLVVLFGLLRKFTPLI